MSDHHYPHRPPSREAAAERADTLIEYLQQVTEMLAATSSEEEVFQTILNPALKALRAEAGTVLLLKNDQLRAVAASGQEGVVSLWQDGPVTMNSPTADAIIGGQPLFFEHSDELLAAYPVLEERTGGQATVANAVLPMVLGGQSLGVIVLDFLQAHDFLDVERRFLRVLSAQCAIALGRIWQFRDQERLIVERTAALNAFAALTEAVGSETDLRVLVLRALEVIQSLLPESSVGYYELEDGLWKAGILSENIDPSLAALTRVGLAYETPSFAKAVQARTFVFTHGWDAQKEEVPMSESYGATALYPYFQAGEPFSMLTIGTQQTRSWTEEERAIIGGVGRSLGLAIERAEVSQRLRERSYELAARTRALEGFASITRTLTPGSDPYALIRQAEELVLSMLPEGYAQYYELIDGRWVDRVQTGDVRSPALQALVKRGFDFERAQSLYLPWTTRQPLYQDEYAPGQDTDPGAVAHLRTVASLPVLMNDQPAGVLVIALFTPRTWSRTDKAVMETTVRSLGLTLERSQQARHQEEERAALEAFARLTEAVGREHDILALARQACTVLRALFENASAVYYELDAGDGLWKAQVWTDDVPAQVKAQLTAGLSADTPMIARVLATLEASFSEGWDMEGEQIAHTEAYTSAGTCPLIVSGRVQGLISVGFKKAQSWSDRERGLLRAVGRSLTLALERAELARQKEEEREALAAFAALTEAVGTQTDALELARQAVEVIRASLSNVSFAYYELESDLWKGRVWSDDLTPAIVSQLRAGVPTTAPNFSQATQLAGPVFVEGWDAESESLPSAITYGAAAFLPIMLGGHARGFVTVGTQYARSWTTGEQGVIRAVVRGLVLALERADHARQQEVHQLAVIEARNRAERAMREAERQHLQAETMTHLAHHDALTGLPNRRRAESSIGRGHPGGHAVCPVLPGPRRLQSGQRHPGHDAGDALLIQITAMLRREMAGPEQVLTRIGGDEFAAMVDGVLDEGQSAAIALRIRSALDVPFGVAGRRVRDRLDRHHALSCRWADPRRPAEECRSGDVPGQARDQERLAALPAGHERGSPSRLLLASGLRGALARHEFQLYYQPQIDLGERRGEMPGSPAALVPGGRGAGVADQFIPAAEVSGLIVPIGQWVLDTACAQLAVWRREGFPELRVAVNVSPVQFARPDFVEAVQSALTWLGWRRAHSNWN